MRYGVIVCPKCKKAKGVYLSSKTTKCTRCNKAIVLNKIKIHFKTDSEIKMRQAIGLINAEMSGDHLNFKQLLNRKKFY